MKKNFHNLQPKLLQREQLLLLIILIASFTACKKKDIPVPLRDYNQVNLVADVDGFNAKRLDASLTNAWGIALSPTGIIWISANHSGTSTVYDKDGNTILSPVWIPAHDKGVGSPTGQVFNGTSGFAIPSTNTISRFIFASEDGVISAWAPGMTSAEIVKDRNNKGSVYKGLAMANDGTGNFLYAADFRNRKIDVFDSTFTLVHNKPFEDNSIPSNYGPFNIRNIDGWLYVTYAKLEGPDDEDDEPGQGHGFVNIFKPDGSLVRRFASRGALNSPWGIVKAEQGFCDITDAILIGNFGDGRINIFDRWGHFEGTLRSDGQPIVIDGLWALENNVPGATGRLYFTAGPADEEHGLFGYLKSK